MTHLTRIITYNTTTEADFTYDAMDVEFIADRAQLKKNIFANEICAAIFSTGSDLNRSTGSVTSALLGTTTIVGDSAVIDAANEGITYPAALLNGVQAYTMLFAFTPNWTGNPAAERYIWVSSQLDAGAAAKTHISILPNGNLYVIIGDNGGGFAAFQEFGAFNAVAGTEKIIGLQVDLAAGTVKAFLNGIQLGSTRSFTPFVKTVNEAVAYLGCKNSTTGYADGSFSWFQFFSVANADTTVMMEPHDYHRISVGGSMILNNNALGTDDLVEFSSLSSSISGSEVKFTLYYDGDHHYFTGGAIAVSDGTWQQANTAAEIESGLPVLDIPLGKSLQIGCVLGSLTGFEQAYVQTVTYEYDFWTDIVLPSTCVIYGYLLDNSGTPVNNATIKISTDDFYYGSNIITVDVSTTTNLNGYFEIELIETATPNVTATFTITYTYSGKLITKVVTGIIPNQTSAALTSFTS